MGHMVIMGKSANQCTNKSVIIANILYAQECLSIYSLYKDVALLYWLHHNIMIPMGHGSVSLIYIYIYIIVACIFACTKLHNFIGPAIFCLYIPN